MNFAFIFPGQGSQSVGMLSELAEQHKEIRQTYKEASDILSQDLWRIVTKGSEEELNLTINAQPILLTACVALWRIWDDLSDQTPSILAGHSLGEYSALVCGGAIKFQDALKLVKVRSELMQEAVPVNKGAMAAVIGLNSNSVIALCKKVDGYVAAANFNSSNQIVVAGEKPAVKQLMKRAKDVGAYKSILLPVSVPSHCRMMEEAANNFSKYVNKTSMVMPKIPVIHNVDATIKSTVEQIKEALIKQMYSPVQWLKTIQHIGEEGIEHFVEVGSGRALTGLVQRIDKNFMAFSLRDPGSFNKALGAVEGWVEI